MLNQLTLIANNLIKRQFRDIISTMSDKEKTDFVNSVRTLNEVADKICAGV